MSTTLLAPPAISFTPKTLRWTCPEFHDLCDAGRFEGRNVILVDGEILERPAPNPPHDAVVGMADYALKRVFSPGYWVRIQTGFPTRLDTDPVPDLVVVPGSPKDYLAAFPRKAVLVVEVADTSLAYDRGLKANLYAAAGIPEYWSLDVNGRDLKVYRDPISDASAPRGFRYATTLTLTPTNARVLAAFVQSHFALGSAPDAARRLASASR